MPPPSRRSERIWFALRQHSFLLALGFTIAVFLGLLFFMTPERSDPQPFAEALTDLSYTKNRPTAETIGPAFGTPALSVTTLPAGATVLVDQDTLGASPVRAHPLSPGIYLISVQKPGYTPVDSVVFVDEGRPAALVLSLTEQAGSDARPALAQARSAGVAPPARSAASTPQAAPSRPDPEPPAGGTLRLTSEPRGASVWLNGRPVGTTPVRVLDVPPGTHTVAFQKDTYESRTMEVPVEARQTQTVAGRLTKRTGTLDLQVKPWGTVYIDGVLRQRRADTRYFLPLAAGSHRITIEHPRLGIWEETLTITAEDTQKVAVHFDRTAADAGMAAPASHQ